MTSVYRLSKGSVNLHDNKGLWTIHGPADVVERDRPGSESEQARLVAFERVGQVLIEDLDPVDPEAEPLAPNTHLNSVRR